MIPALRKNRNAVSYNIVIFVDLAGIQNLWTVWRALSGTQPASVLVQFNKESSLFCVMHTSSKVIFNVPIYSVPVSLPVELVLLSVRVHITIAG